MTSTSSINSVNTSKVDIVTTPCIQGANRLPFSVTLLHYSTTIDTACIDKAQPFWLRLFALVFFGGEEHGVHTPNLYFLPFF